MDVYFSYTSSRKYMRLARNARADAVIPLLVLYQMASKLLTVSSVRDIDQAKELLDNLHEREV